MKRPKLPKTDSIAKLAAFWDVHDLSDFEDELQDVTTPIFGRRRASAKLEVPLDRTELQALERIASTKGVTSAALVREWVRQKLPRTNGSRNARA